MVQELSLSQKRDLMDAIAQNDSKIITLLESVPTGNLDFFMPDTQLSPFMLAIESNAMDAFEALIQAAHTRHMGTRIDTVNIYGMNALSTAVLNEQPEMVKKLIFLGASPLMPLIPGKKTVYNDSLPSSMREEAAYTRSSISLETGKHKSEIGLRMKEIDTQTPFSLAVDMNFSKSVLYMMPVIERETLTYQVRRLAEMPGRLEIFKLLVERCHQLDNSYNQKTPLIAACEAGEAEKVRLLIQHGANPSKDVEGYTPLMAAARHGNTEIITYLIPYLTKEQINHVYRGVTALGIAVWYKNEMAAIYLMDRGADLSIRLPGDRTLLRSAVEFNLPRLGKVLLEQKKTLFQQEKAILSLWTAIRLKRNQFVCLLCDAGVDVNIANRRGVTPFALAVSCGNWEAALELYCAGANINTPDEKGVTPLHRCIKRGKKNAIKWLIEKGAYLNTQDDQGQTPLMYAAQKGDISLFLYLIQKGADKEVYDCYGKKAVAYLYATQKKHLSPSLIKEAMGHVQTRS